MFNTELGRFCAEHDNWEELLTSEPYNLKISEDGTYVMFKYNQLSSDFNTPIVREARGIIFKKGSWETPVCWAFNKFGNYGESYVPDIDWATALVTEKIDGSLIKMWYDDGDWHISTNGTIDAFKAENGNALYESFGSYFYATLCERYYKIYKQFLSGLDKNLTYMFELVGPYNRVVVPYEYKAIYFLGARNKFTGEEHFCTTPNMERFGVIHFNKPKVYPLSSLEDCIKLAEEFSWDQEGFVVGDAKFNRVKIKSPAYVMAHFARNNNVITKRHLIKVIITNEVEEFICYAEDYREELFKVKSVMNDFYITGNKFIEECNKLTSLPRKEYAEVVKTLPSIFHGMLYRNYTEPCSAQEFTADWDENKWEQYLDSFEKLSSENKS